MIITVVALLAGMQASIDGRTPSCPSRDVLSAINNLGSIYIGEVHGTKEAPGFVRCVVDYEVSVFSTPITVSLELPNGARDAASPYWGGKDGRASNAMFGLVQHLEMLASMKKIRLIFQEGGSSRDDAFDRKTGIAIRTAAKQGRILAYGGNFHAMGVAPEGTPPERKPAGTYVGSDVRHLLISSARGGQAWVCLGDLPCGARDIPPSRIPGAKANALAVAGVSGFDYVYFVPSYTFSPPRSTCVDGLHKGTCGSSR